MSGGKPTGHPDSAPWAAAKAGVVVARISVSSGEVSVSTPPELERMLSSAEVADWLGIARGTWWSYVSRGQAPAPDDPDDARPVNRRTPRWSLATVTRWREGRPGRGKRRA